MSTQSTTTEVQAPQRQRLIVQDNTAIGYLMDSAKFEHCCRIAKLMASSSLIPDHLQKVKVNGQMEWLSQEQITGNCFLIVNQALRWGFDPFAVAPETYVVGGKLAYQGKLVLAAINALANLDGRLRFTYSGKIGTDDFTITVAGRFSGDTTDCTVSVSVGQAKTTNEMWRKDPEQKLVYTGATKWARRYCPEIILGIMVEDEQFPVPVQTTGRELPETNPLAPVTSEPVGSTDNYPTKATAKNATKAATKREAAVPQDAVVIPSRQEMAVALQATYRAIGIKLLPDAESIIRKAGMLHDGTGLSGLSDSELFKIYEARERLFVAPEAEEADPGDNYPMDEEKGGEA